MKLSLLFCLASPALATPISHNSFEDAIDSFKQPSSQHQNQFGAVGEDKDGEAVGNYAARNSQKFPKVGSLRGEQIFTGDIKATETGVDSENNFADLLAAEKAVAIGMTREELEMAKSAELYWCQKSDGSMDGEACPKILKEHEREKEWAPMNMNRWMNHIDGGRPPCLTEDGHQMSPPPMVETQEECHW